MTQPEHWSRALTATIAEQVNRLRTHRKMSAQQLADATAQLGHPIARSVIANLESGRRDSVSVAEIIVLARALHVPPVLIVFPLGHKRTVRVLPDTEVDTWASAKWFTGEAPFPGSDEAVDESPASYFREQDQLIAEWHRYRRDVARARAEVGQRPERPDIELARQQEATYLEEAFRSQERALRMYRALIRRQGVDPGELPPELAHVDEGS